MMIYMVDDVKFLNLGMEFFVGNYYEKEVLEVVCDIEGLEMLFELMGVEISLFGDMVFVYGEIFMKFLDGS